MIYCQTCGGELGRECFNPSECAQHAADMAYFASGMQLREDGLPAEAEGLQPGGVAETPNTGEL